MARKFWDQEDFGFRLRGMMYVREVTQQKLAKALKLNQGTISRWQRNPANAPSLDHVAAAAHYLKVDPGWLAFGTSQAPPNSAPLLKKINALELDSRLRNRSIKRKKKKRKK